MTNDEIVSQVVGRHFKKLESKLVELKLPQVVYITISREFRWLETDLKKALDFQGDDLQNIMEQ